MLAKDQPPHGLTSSLSEIDGRALCYPAFPQAVRLRKLPRDGVNCDPRSGNGPAMGRPSLLSMASDPTRPGSRLLRALWGAQGWTLDPGRAQHAAPNRNAGSYRSLRPAADSAGRVGYHAVSAGERARPSGRGEGQAQHPVVGVVADSQPGRMRLDPVGAQAAASGADEDLPGAVVGSLHGPSGVQGAEPAVVV